MGALRNSTQFLDLARQVGLGDQIRVVVNRANHGIRLADMAETLGMPIAAPELDAFGYRFIGGRLLPSTSGAPAAQLMYENAEGRRFMLYIRTDLRNTREIEFQFTREGDVNVLY